MKFTRLSFGPALSLFKVLLLVVVTLPVLAVGVFLATAEQTPSVSELAFIEYSSDHSVMGSVIPASCESGYEHYAGECAPPPPPAPVINFSVSPNPINYGQVSTLTWSVANVFSCSASGGWAGAKSATGGSEGVSPSFSTSYTITCSGPGGTISSSVSVTVNPPAVTFTATPNHISPGTSSTLSWTATAATTCTASGGWSGAKSNTGGSESVTPTGTTVYNLSCTGPSGTTNVSQTVTVPSGFISATPCIVPLESTSCNTVVVWNAYNFIGTPSVLQAGTEFSTLPSHLGLTVVASPSSTTFTLDDTGSSFLATYSADVQCAADSVWAGGRCVTLPEIVVTADPNIVRSGNTAPIEIEITANYDLTCTLYGAVVDSFTHAPSASAQTYSYTTRPLTSAQLVRVVCESPLYPAVRGEAEERIEVIPTVQEI